MSLPAGYSLRQGSTLERALLLKFMQHTYAEIAPSGGYSHLAETVEQYFSRETPLWWVDWGSQDKGMTEVPAGKSDRSSFILNPSSSIACLWLGRAVDQLSGDRHTHVFLLYVAPDHRRRGIGAALMHHAEDWARARGDRQIGLQVFQSNQPALSLYHSLGFQVQSLGLTKWLLPLPSK